MTLTSLPVFQAQPSLTSTSSCWIVQLRDFQVRDTHRSEIHIHDGLSQHFQNKKTIGNSIYYSNTAAPKKHIISFFPILSISFVYKIDPLFARLFCNFEWHQVYRQRFHNTLLSYKKHLNYSDS
jgi:hypothetical protein